MGIESAAEFAEGAPHSTTPVAPGCRAAADTVPSAGRDRVVVPVPAVGEWVGERGVSLFEQLMRTRAGRPADGTGPVGVCTISPHTTTGAAERDSQSTNRRGQIRLIP